jgi:NADH-quinone oxidoreductase subunit F
LIGKEQTLSRLNSVAELEARRKSIIKNRDPKKPSVFICGGTGCKALGADKVLSTFEQSLQEKGLSDKVGLKSTGCRGFCERGPLVLIEPNDTFYQQIKRGSHMKLRYPSTKNKSVSCGLISPESTPGILMIT